MPNLLGMSHFPDQAAQTPAPVNPSATPEARELLAFLYQISGHQTLSGQHNTPEHMADYNRRAEEITGKYPAVWGQDFGFSATDMDAVKYRPAVMEEAKRQHAAGSVITLMWHAVRPIEDEPGTFKESICGKITDQDWRDLLTPGTDVYNRWLAQADVIAGFLTGLRDANIPVLWRPYHEMNGDWFWWGKASDNYIALWKQMYDRFVNHHRLDNLLWVWNANAPAPHILPYPACYPGAEYVDILATDIYGNDYKPSHYDDLVTLANGKPVALGEVGVMPTPEIIDAQPLWTWFMTWTNFLTNHNTPEAVRALYSSPRVRSRPAMPA